MKNPQVNRAKGVDTGLVCKIEGSVKQDYFKMLAAQDNGLLGQVNLQDKSVALEMRALRK